MDISEITTDQKVEVIQTLFDHLEIPISAKDLMSLKNMAHATAEQERKFSKFNLRKKVFIQAYSANYGNVSASCKKARIHRQTYYDWMKNDPAFIEYIEGLQIKDVADDMNELMIMKLVEEANPYVVLQRARMKMRHRGYIDHNSPEQVEHKNVHWFLPDNGRDPQTHDVTHKDVTEKKANSNKSRRLKQ